MVEVLYIKTTLSVLSHLYHEHLVQEKICTVAVFKLPFISKVVFFWNRFNSWLVG